tara:strand:- start:53 stop:292 length:240 start_codon:yes stop_codon:yes gene_type:complete
MPNKRTSTFTGQQKAYSDAAAEEVEGGGRNNADDHINALSALFPWLAIGSGIGKLLSSDDDEGLESVDNKGLNLTGGKK